MGIKNQYESPWSRLDEVGQRESFELKFVRVNKSQPWSIKEKMVNEREPQMFKLGSAINGQLWSTMVNYGQQ